MKILYAEHVSESHAQSNIKGMIKAYRRLGKVEIFDDRGTARQVGVQEMNRQLLALAVKFKPDFIHMGKCESVKGKTIKEIKDKVGSCVVHFYPDLRDGVIPHVADVGRYADWTLLQHDDPVIHDLHKKAGCRRTGFWFVGTDPEVYYPRKVKKEYDAIFMGAPRAPRCGRERVRLIFALANAGIKVHVFGRAHWNQHARRNENVTKHGFKDQEDFATVCSKAKIVLGYNANVKMYTSWRRPLNSMASGAFMLMRYFEGLETVFRNHHHLVWFESFDEAMNLAKRYLQKGGKRKAIARRGREEVLAKHTWNHRIAWMMSHAREAGYSF